MSRPPLEVADLVRSAGIAFIERNRQWIRWTHIKVLLAIARCRTGALGGHIEECTRCGHRAAISYNSCRNRHCPKCQIGARERWIQARRRELLSSPYVHVVFTLPHQLASRALQNKNSFMVCCFVPAQKPSWKWLVIPDISGPRSASSACCIPGTRNSSFIPMSTLSSPAGGLSLDHTRWIRSRSRFFLSIQVLRRVFRGKFVAGLRSAFQRGQLHLSG